VHGKGIDDNELITRYKVDPIMGGTGMNVNFVTFLRAADVAVDEPPAVVTEEVVA
jgi:thiosulfate reductase/polysulfide reductase chain A